MMISINAIDASIRSRSWIAMSPAGWRTIGEQMPCVVVSTHATLARAIRFIDRVVLTFVFVMAPEVGVGTSRAYWTVCPGSGASGGFQLLSTGRPGAALPT